MWLNLVIIGVVIMMGIIVYYQFHRASEAKRNGNFYKREMHFWEYEEVFAMTGVSLDEVISKMSELDYSSLKATVQAQANGGILVQSKYGWNGVVEPFPSNGDTTCYCCSFVAWDARRNIPDTLSMNVFYTMVEKAMLSLDKDAIVQTRRIKTKTKSY